MQMSYSYLPYKNFCKLGKQAETIRNSTKKDFGYDYMYSFFMKLRNQLDTRVKSFLANKRKSLRIQQPARADIIHSNREIKENFDPEKLTFAINSEHESA